MDARAFDFGSGEKPDLLREYLIGQALSGLCARAYPAAPDQLAEDAVDIADAVLRRLGHAK